MVEACSLDPKCCNGKEIAPGVVGIGDIWVGAAGDLRTLADVWGRLCIIELKLKPSPHSAGEKSS